MGNAFIKTRVVTKDFFKDWLQRMRNLLGMRQTAYEEKIILTVKGIFEELSSEGKISWWRMNQDVIGDAIIISIYGEYK